MRNLFLCVLIGIVTSGVVSGCPDGWVTFRGSCYLFANQPSHFTEAENFCTQHGSHLVHIETSDENIFLRSFVGELKVANHWIGLTDITIEGIWKWTDTDTGPEFSDWYPGQPDGAKGSNCGALYHPFLFHWADEPCSLNNHPICERSDDVSTGTDLVGK